MLHKRIDDEQLLQLRIRNRIGKALRELGVPEHLNGYGHLVDAVELAVRDPSLIRKMTTVLYPTVAEKGSATSQSTERAIRHAIERAWLRCDPDAQLSYFGNTIDPEKGKPTNSEFIARVSNAVRQEVLS